MTPAVRPSPPLPCDSSQRGDEGRLDSSSALGGGQVCDEAPVVVRIRAVMAKDEDDDDVAGPAASSRGLAKLDRCPRMTGQRCWTRRLRARGAAAEGD